MSGIISIVVLAICITLSECQNNTKIRIIYDDMDMDDDGFVFFQDMQAYFKAYTDFLLLDHLDFYAFDLIWGLVYNDSRPVIKYIFDKWDQSTQDGNITNADALVLFDIIDNWGDSATPGFLEYSFEFEPYFQALYVEAESAAVDENVGK